MKHLIESQDISYACFSCNYRLEKLVSFCLVDLSHDFDALQSFLAGLAASGTLISGLRLLTKVAFEKADNGLRKGASMPLLLTNGHVFQFYSHFFLGNCYMLRKYLRRNARNDFWPSDFSINTTIYSFPFYSRDDTRAILAFRLKIFLNA